MRICSKCGSPLPLQTGRGARRKMCATCSPSRDRKGKKPRTKTAPKPKIARRSLVSSVTAELTSAGMLDSHQGQAALLLAKRLASGEDSGASMAQVVRQLRETMTAAMAAAAPPEADPVDELRAKREKRRGA